MSDLSIPIPNAMVATTILACPVHEPFLDLVSLFRFHPGVIGFCIQPGGDASCRDLFGGLLQSNVNNRRPGFSRFQFVDQDGRAFMFVNHLGADVKVRAKELGANDVVLFDVKRATNVVLYGGRCRCG